MRVATPITLSDSDKKTLEKKHQKSIRFHPIGRALPNSPVLGSGPGEQGDRTQAQDPTKQSRQVEKQICRGWHDGNQ